MIDFTKVELEKLSEKGSFLIQKSLFEDIMEMTDAEASFFILAIFEYVLNGTEPNLLRQSQRTVRIAFNRFKRDYKSDSTKWLKSCKRKSDTKKQEWKARKGNASKTDSEGNPKMHPKYSH